MTLLAQLVCLVLGHSWLYVWPSSTSVTVHCRRCAARPNGVQA